MAEVLLHTVIFIGGLLSGFAVRVLWEHETKLKKS